MEAFEPPKYITSLIAAINDGAKSAQAGAFLFLLVGLYLLATAFSASDEDLLLGHTVAIAQIGASLPVSFSFVITPMVFVFLHIYALVRFDLLAANVRQFRVDVESTVPFPWNRERCRQLLANVEFIVALAAPRGSALYSRLWPWLFRGIVAVFPVVVLLLVQINALRYQSDAIMWTQRAWLTVDVIALIWFFRRNRLDGQAWPDRAPARIGRWVRLLLWPCLVGIVNGLYLNTVPAETAVEWVRFDSAFILSFRTYWRNYAGSNPLDLFFCPRLKVGCRFLRTDHRTLVEKVWDEKALVVLRALDGEPDSNTTERAKAVTAVEGVVLRNRSLRFVVLEDSRLYSADLGGADLSAASLRGAELSYARLSGARLVGADLIGAHLVSTHMPVVNLTDTHLEGADMHEAELGGSIVVRTHFANANLVGAKLSSIDLTNALELTQAQLDGACGSNTKPPPGLTLKPCPRSVGPPLNPK